jgi:hypothetical protein
LQDVESDRAQFKNKKSFWDAVAAKMKQAGQTLSLDGKVCYKNWHNLYVQYREKADKQSKTGRGAGKQRI